MALTFAILVASVATIAHASESKAGLTQEDFIGGVQVGHPDLVMGLLFDPTVKTLSW